MSLSEWSDFIQKKLDKFRETPNLILHFRSLQFHKVLDAKKNFEFCTVQFPTRVRCMQTFHPKPIT